MAQRTEHSVNGAVVLSEVAAPKSAIALGDALALIVGLVIGVGIFQTPSIVASNLGSNSAVLLAWFLGGVMSLIGALCYGELATAYPHAGGNYHYFMRAFGSKVAFLFAWARMTVIQTGSIATVAFVFGDYASELLRLGDYSASIYAALAVILLTSLNIVGVEQGKWAQNWLSIAKVLGLLLVIIVGATFIAPSVPPVTAPATTQTNWGSAMVFVLFSFGGWNEAAYISAELHNVKKNMVRLLMWSIGIITTIYLLINFAYLHGLGLTAMAQSEAVAADLMRSAFGQPGALFISLLIAIATLGATNANIFTGARTNYALGQDFRTFSFLGHWNRANTPKNALLVQGAITLALVLLGSFTRKGFTTMVDYTAPVFWFFFLLSGVSLFVLRAKEPQTPRPFRVPFYPITPMLFCLVCGYLLYSSLVYTGIGAAFGVAVVVAGLPLLWRSSYQN
ncbi:APC family permease [Synechocystis sp. PCC 7509]|uniref:APC family permease n=1 Tax=Synechocystis sp. PCC 7509 TaxID=927677 RepID=UPI0002ABD39C|nr:amino acid permease [Synechocystis sp. PCC 7509]